MMRLEDCFVRLVRTSHDPTTSNAASQPMTEADVLELARSLEGAEVVDAEWFGQSYADYCVPVGNTGPFLVIPLPDEEER